MTPHDESVVVELCAGPGGMSEGIHYVGVPKDQIIGIDNSSDACETARRNGHPRVHADLLTIAPIDVERPTGIHASPPCPGFSRAGKGDGRADLPLLSASAASLADRDEGHDSVMRNVMRHQRDPRSAISLIPMRWIMELKPEWVTLEQVPGVLPLWQVYAHALRRAGYSVWCGTVTAEQYGVPQTRQRAILLASRVIPIDGPPPPTHTKFHIRSVTRLDPGVEKWVSMAEALGWGLVTDEEAGEVSAPARGRIDGRGHWIERFVGFPRRYDGIGEVFTINGTDYRARDLRPSYMPAFTVTEKARSWAIYEGDVEMPFEGRRITHMGDVRNSKGAIRPMGSPAMTMTSSMDNGNFMFIDAERVEEQVRERLNNQSGSELDMRWPAYRPAQVVAGREINTAPGANANRFNGRTKSRNDGVRIEPFEAATLQSFPADYRFHGTKTSQFIQIGNAVPPLLGWAMVRHVTTPPEGVLF